MSRPQRTCDLSPLSKPTCLKQGKERQLSAHPEPRQIRPTISGSPSHITDQIIQEVQLAPTFPVNPGSDLPVNESVGVVCRDTKSDDIPPGPMNVRPIGDLDCCPPNDIFTRSHSSSPLFSDSEDDLSSIGENKSNHDKNNDSHTHIVNMTQTIRPRSSQKEKVVCEENCPSPHTTTSISPAQACSNESHIPSRNELKSNGAHAPRSAYGNESTQDFHLHMTLSLQDPSMSESPTKVHQRVTRVVTPDLVKEYREKRCATKTVTPDIVKAYREKQYCMETPEADKVSTLGSYSNLRPTVNAADNLLTQDEPTLLLRNRISCALKEIKGRSNLCHGRSTSEGESMDCSHSDIL